MNITYKYFNNGSIAMYLDKTLIGRAYIQDPSEPSIYLELIYIKDEYMNQGYGTFFLKEIFHKYKDKIAITLFVDVNNPAIHLYQRLGFFIAYTIRKKKEHTKHYAMTKKL